MGTTSLVFSNARSEVAERRPFDYGEIVTEKPKANFYFDGFSLYYGCVKGTRWKWLDLSALCNKIYPKLEIQRIRYFSARVTATSRDQSVAQRQDVYLRALMTVPNLSIHCGTFMSHPRYMKVVDPPEAGPAFVKVMYTEEKGSDVNLASFLLFDAFQKEFDVAVVVSNDSDLCEPIRMVREELKLPVGVLIPASVEGRRPSHDLKQISDQNYSRMIQPRALRACQFPDTLEDNEGKFSKPSSW